MARPPALDNLLRLDGYLWDFQVNLKDKIKKGKISNFQHEICRRYGVFQEYLKKIEEVCIEIIHFQNRSTDKSFTKIIGNFVDLIFSFCSAAEWTRSRRATASTVCTCSPTTRFTVSSGAPQPRNSPSSAISVRYFNFLEKALFCQL